MKKIIFDNLYDRIDEYDFSERLKEKYFVVDWNKIENEVTEIKDNDNLIAVIINILDTWTYDEMNKIIEKIKTNDKYMDVKIYITTKGKDIFRTEKYLQSLERWLKQEGYEFETVGIPLCYAQDFIENHHDTKIFLEEKELAFKEYHYFEDCRFCKLRGICPGALKHYDDDVYAAFKDAEEYYEYGPRIVDKNTINNAALRSIEPNSKVWLIPYRSVEENSLSILNEKLKKLNVEISYGLKLDESLMTLCNKFELMPFKSKGRYSYKTLDDKRFIRFLVDVDIFDSIVLVSNTKDYQKIVYDLIHEADLKKLELDEKTLKKLFGFIKPKIHLIYLNKSQTSNPNSPQLV